jgi:hypothetical protein
MTLKAADEVFSDGTGISLRAAGHSESMTIAWGDIVSLDVVAMKLPDRTLRLITLVHRCGAGLEIAEDCVGFVGLVAEICRRFCLAPGTSAAVASLAPGSALHFDVPK